MRNSHLSPRRRSFGMFPQLVLIRMVQTCIIIVRRERHESANLHVRMEFTLINISASMSKSFERVHQASRQASQWINTIVERRRAVQISYFLSFQFNHSPASDVRVVNRRMNKDWKWFSPLDVKTFSLRKNRKKRFRCRGIKITNRKKRFPTQQHAARMENK